MPELPEVETTRRGLALKLQGRRIARIEARRPDLRFPLPKNFAKSIQGRRVEALERRAKYILVRLEGDLVWIIHLGMSGRMVIRAGWPNDIGPHDHVIFATEDGAAVTFNDARRFGMMDLVPATKLSGHRLLAGIGPEPLDEAFTPAVLAAALAGKKTPMKAALLDQTVVAGLGNIYVSEALFRAGISPRRLAHTVPGLRARHLVPAIKDVLTEAIAVGGSSLRDHVQPNGELGYFQHAWRVYGRAGERCAACPGPPKCRGIAQLVQAGRSSFYCPRTQR